ncbi:putative aldouronate transport system permease protein [Paenibacillus sp. UNC496MF]|uniref:ABC transporter permease n=1 Tax=Paenibacillus sp. UNC496MF TaxID=1502753 RepID=UPI0008EA1876|nr:ABC transporter permease subunit [Paenibacillus sp. UNC496MF]SFJ02774.1 putative aldouronate transport system permease protein [Paenibacillus sp. UNC496MF]
MSVLTGKRTASPKRGKRLKTQNVKVLYLFLLPALALTFVFAYLPMFSNYIAFLDYDFNKGWFGFGSPFVGFDNFAKFLHDHTFYTLIGRTLLYSVTMMVATFPAPLILALLLNELRGERFKKVVQTTSYIPHFVSWVTVAGLFYLFLTVDATGLVNNIRQFFDPGAERISFMQDAHNFLPVLVISEIWKETGWGTILYLAALTTIDPQQYEAAQVDGASRFQRLRYITLPGLVPTMCILLIFSLSGLLATNFDQVFNLQNKMIRLDTDTIGVYTYYQGLVSGQYSYSAAVGLFQGLVSFILIMATNATTKRLSNVGII